MKKIKVRILRPYLLLSLAGMQAAEFKGTGDPGIPLGDPYHGPTDFKSGKKFEMPGNIHREEDFSTEQAQADACRFLDSDDGHPFGVPLHAQQNSTLLALKNFSLNTRIGLLMILTLHLLRQPAPQNLKKHLWPMSR